MTETQTTSRALSPARLAIAIASLAMGGFGIGVTEFASMGLLRSIADGFGTTEAATGVVISAYALGVVIGAPLLTIAAARMRRKNLLLVLVALFILGNGLSALAPSLNLLIVARFLAGVPHGAYFGAACLVAAAMAGKGREARAVSLVILGLSVANVVGVPGATFLGDAVGWEWAFGVVAAIGALTFVSIAVFVPNPASLETVSVKDELSALRQPQVLYTLAMGAVGFGGLFAIYSYIQWTMVEVSGVPREAMPAVLAVYGVGMVIGGLIGGALADRNLERTVLYGIAVMAGMLAVFYLATPNAVTAVIALFLVGLSSSAVIPALQTRLMQWAGRGQTLAAALNHSALNTANALGAWLGGVVIAAGWGYRAPAVAAIGLALGGLAIAVPAVIQARKARSAVHGSSADAAPTGRVSEVEALPDER